MKKRYDSSHNVIRQAEINELFSQITPEEVEQFYKTYQLWSKHQEIAHVQQEISQLREKQAQNAILMQEATPSAVALATLAQLRASGVEDVDLLDRMLDRGEEWLDHTMQLLERCEDLNVIRGNYTQWCEHALDGAYEWMGSMDDASLHDYFHAEAASEELLPQALMNANSTDVTDIVTEDQLLRKLMSEDGTSTKRNTVPLPRITQDLPPLITYEDEEDSVLESAATVTSDVEEQTRARAEQQTYQENQGTREQEENLADLSPAEREESADSIVEIVDQAQPLEADTHENAEVQDPEEQDPREEKAHAIPAQTGASTDMSKDSSIDASEEDFIQPEETDEPVSSLASPPEAVDGAVDAPVAEESEPGDDIKLDSSTSAGIQAGIRTDIQANEPTQQASSDVEQQETTLGEDDTDLKQSPPLTNPSVDTSSEPVMNATATEAKEEAKEESKEESPAQWPFVYQEIENTSLPTSTPDNTTVQNEVDKRGSTQAKRKKKKPRKEASRRSIKKKPGFFRRLSARFFRR